MTTAPSISLLMPVYNGSNYLQTCLESVVPQLGESDELVVQDGGSTDGTIDIIASWSERHPQLKVVSESDDGQADALQRALRRAQGDYIGWVNCDDIVFPDALDTVRGVASSGPYDLIFGDAVVTLADGTVLRRLSARRVQYESLLRLGCYVFSGSCFFRGAFIRDLGFDINLQYCMDFDLLLRAARSTGWSQFHVDVVLAALRLHESSKSGSLGWNFVSEARAVRRNALGRDGRRVGLSLLQYDLIPTALHAARIATSRIRYSRLYTAARGRERARRL